MSAKGLTVHEANLEENRITFNGFPWPLRLRMIMERAANLSEAKALWKETNNTVSDSWCPGVTGELTSMHSQVGFNHMVRLG